MGPSSRSPYHWVENTIMLCYLPQDAFLVILWSYLCDTVADGPLRLWVRQPDFAAATWLGSLLLRPSCYGMLRSIRNEIVVAIMPRPEPCNHVLIICVWNYDRIKGAANKQAWKSLVSRLDFLRWSYLYRSSAMKCAASQLWHAVPLWSIHVYQPIG